MSAKDIVVKPISRADADRIVKSCHYSGKVVQNSQLHFGVFLHGKCGGAMQFGPSLDKRKIQGLVEGTGWNNFIELNRMAFSDWLPRNSESRAISVAMKLIRKSYPHIEWVVSFADGTQCGDGTIYRASGFVLTGITKNTTLWEFEDGERVANIAIKTGHDFQKRKFGKVLYGEAGIQKAREIGAKQIPGFQLRYIYFLNPAARSRLTVPILPFSEIQKRGAGMYLGKPKRAGSDTTDTAPFQGAEGGSIPTPALHLPTA
jgi:hypothetical protein